MLKRVVITNYLGETMEYKIDGVEVDNPSGLIITSIDGLGPGKATVNMTDISTTDGRLYNSARLTGRNIVIKALFTHATSIEEARLLSYKYFPIKKKVHILIETDSRIAETDGYVESNEPDIFSEESGCQISILCEDAFFDGGASGRINRHLSLPPAETNIEYSGDYGTGIEMEMSVSCGSLLTPTKITDITVNKNQDEQMHFDMSKMANLVPSTYHVLSNWYQTSFVTNGSEHRFLGDIPEPFEFTNKGFVVVDGSEGNTYRDIHCFYNPNNGSDESGAPTSYLVHFMFIREKQRWLKLDNISVPCEPEWMVNYLGSIYAYFKDVGLLGEMHRSSGSSNYYTYNFDTTYECPFNDYYSGYRYVRTYACVTGDTWIKAIQCIIEYEDNNGLIYHDQWSRGVRTSGQWVKSTNNIGDIMGNGFDTSDRYSSGYMILDNGTRIVPGLNDGIYIIGGKKYHNVGATTNTRVTYNSFLLYSAAGDRWQDVTDTSYALPGTVNDQASTLILTDAVTYDNKLYIFCYGGVYDTLYCFSYGYNQTSSSSGWGWINRRQNVVPSRGYLHDSGRYKVNYNNIVSDYRPSVGSLDKYMYVIGGASAGQYSVTEEPDNIKLIGGDKLIVNTNERKKSVKLLRDGIEYNVLNVLDSNPSWFELYSGSNIFSYNATIDENKLGITIKANIKYQGV